MSLLTVQKLDPRCRNVVDKVLPRGEAQLEEQILQANPMERTEETKKKPTVNYSLNKLYLPCTTNGIAVIYVQCWKRVSVSWMLEVHS
jgi:hypothetical protein